MVWRTRLWSPSSWEGKRKEIRPYKKALIGSILSSGPLLPATIKRDREQRVVVNVRLRRVICPQPQPFQVSKVCLKS